MEKEMAAHSSIPTWTPWMEKPGGLQSMKSQIVGHDSLALQNANAVILGLPQWLTDKNLPADARDVGSIPGLGRSLGGGNGNPLQLCRVLQKQGI